MQGRWAWRDAGGRGVNRKAEKEWLQRREKPGEVSAQKLMEESVQEPCLEEAGAI